MVHSCFADITARRQRVEKSLRNGTLTPGDGTALMEGWAYIYRDGPVPVLGMGQSGSADVAHANEDRYAIPFTITTYQEDRDGDIVVPLGWRGEHYAKNPVWFFGHQQWEISIGKSIGPDGKLYVFPEEKQIKSVCFFDKEDEDAMYIYGKVMRGFLNATSIAFVPIDAARRDNEYSHEKARTHSQNPMMPLGWLFKVWDHTETSIVGVGANTGAIRDSLDKEWMYITPKCRKAIGMYAAKAKGRCFSGWCPCPPEQGSSRSPCEKGDQGSRSNTRLRGSRIDTAYALKAGAEPTFQTGDQVVVTYSDTNEVPLDKIGKVVDIVPGTTSLHDPQDVEGARGEIVPTPNDSQFQTSDYGGEPQAVGTQQVPLTQKPQVGGEEIPTSSTKYLVDFGDRKLWISEESLEGAPPKGNEVKQDSAGSKLGQIILPGDPAARYAIPNRLKTWTRKQIMIPPKPTPSARNPSLDVAVASPAQASKAEKTGATSCCNNCEHGKPCKTHQKNIGGGTQADIESPAEGPSQLQGPEGQEIKDGQPSSDIDPEKACLLPDQSIQGRIIAGSKAWYSGPAVKLRTASGITLSVTTNHPVLTEKGFISAGNLCKGDNLLHYVGKDKSTRRPDYDIQYAPTVAEEVFKSLGSFREKSHVSGLDFHGDAAFFQSDVEIVGTNRELLEDIISDTYESLRESEFVGISEYQSTLPSRSRPLQLAGFVDSPNVGLMSRADDGLPLFSSHSRPLNSIGFRTSTEEIGFSQESVDNRPAQSDVDGDLIRGSANVVKRSNHLLSRYRNVSRGLRQPIIFGLGSELDISLFELGTDRMTVSPILSSNLCHRFPRDIVFDNVIDVERFHYDGPVYDFQSPLGYILAEELVVSNCQILHDGTVHGKPLTDSQRRMFGAACSRAKKSWGGLRETCKAMLNKGKDSTIDRAREAKPGTGAVGNEGGEGAYETSEGVSKPQVGTPDIQTPGWIACATCQKTGNCPDCEGTGENRVDGSHRECRRCEGSGDCFICDGKGIVRKPNDTADSDVTDDKSALGSIPAQANKEQSRDEIGRFAGGESEDEVDRKRREEARRAQASARELRERKGIKMHTTNVNSSVRSKGRKAVDEGTIGAVDAQEEPVVEGDKKIRSKASVDMPFNPKPSAQVLAALYSHAKAEAQYLEGELTKMDNDGVRTDLTDYQDNFPGGPLKRMEHYSSILGKYHPDHDMEKMMKALETDNAGPAAQGEAQVVDQGQVPPDPTAMDMPETEEPAPPMAGGEGEEAFAGVETPEEETAEAGQMPSEQGGSRSPKAAVDEPFNPDPRASRAPSQKPTEFQGGKASVDEPFNPGGGSTGIRQPSQKPTNYTGQSPVDNRGKASVDEPFEPQPNRTGTATSVKQDSSDPDTEEILERYRHPKSGKMMVRKVGIIRRAADGSLYLVQEKGTRTPMNDRGRAQHDSGTAGDKFGSELSDRGHSQHNSGTSGDKMDSETTSEGVEEQANTAANSPHGEYIVGSGKVDWGKKAAKYQTTVTKAAKHLYALTKAEDMPEHHKSGLEYHAKELGGMGKDIELTLGQRTNHPEKSNGQQQQPVDQSAPVGSLIEQKFKALQRRFQHVTGKSLE